MNLVVNNLGHRFDQGWLFREVNFDIAPGQRLLVWGNNGSGKSTLLRCIAGLLIPLEGEMSVPSNVGYAALDQSLYPSLSAEEHLIYSARLRGVIPRTDELLAQVGLEKSRQKPCRTFSTGMRARLKVALALQSNPTLLLLDEPTAALDESGRNFINETMRDFGGMVVYASNDPDDRRWATHELEL